ncbi:MAG: hypothetical protein KGL39_58560 [Patescibacteria group bacterium]|nr:hypothetical protein [Patescibacteria group bacterium]
MAKYAVTAKVVGSTYLGTFEAHTEEEAIKTAIDANGSVCLCHQCSSKVEDPELVEFYAFLEDEEDDDRNS